MKKKGVFEDAEKSVLNVQHEWKIGNQPGKYEKHRYKKEKTEEDH